MHARRIGDGIRSSRPAIIEDYYENREADDAFRFFFAFRRRKACVFLLNEGFEGGAVEIKADFKLREALF